MSLLMNVLKKSALLISLITPSLSMDMDANTQLYQQGLLPCIRYHAVDWASKGGCASGVIYMVSGTNILSLGTMITIPVLGGILGGGYGGYKYISFWGNNFYDGINECYRPAKQEEDRSIYYIFRALKLPQWPLSLSMSRG